VRTCSRDIKVTHEPIRRAVDGGLAFQVLLPARPVVLMNLKEFASKPSGEPFGVGVPTEVGIAKVPEFVCSLP
jgi:hypothetical protein